MKYDPDRNPYDRIHQLELENAKLKRRVIELEKTSSDYLMKWVNSQELASNRQVVALMGKVLTADGQVIDPMRPNHNMVHWLPASAFTPPHGVSHPDHVIELANSFVEHGWDRNCPVLIGYPWENKIQLLSGSHRWIAAEMAEILIPVIVLPYKQVEDAWGDTDKWTMLMRLGDGALIQEAA